jgi:hypothetical protein
VNAASANAFQRKTTDLAMTAEHHPLARDDQEPLHQFTQALRHVRTSISTSMEICLPKENVNLCFQTNGNILISILVQAFCFSSNTAQREPPELCDLPFPENERAAVAAVRERLGRQKG